MGTISRPTKAGGNTTYVAEVAAGNTTILDSEVDADFATIYNEFNGSVDANNLATDAVETAKIKNLNVTIGKLALGASTNNATQDSDGSGGSITGTEASLLTRTITSRGGYHLILVSLTGNLLIVTPPDSVTVTVRIRRGGLAGTVVGTMNGNVSELAGGTKDSHPLSVAVFGLEQPGSGSTQYDLTAQITAGGGSATWSTAQLIVVEFA